MPWCPGVHRIKIGLFHAVLVKILRGKARKSRKAQKYSPYCQWDFFTGLSYRTAVTTLGAVVFLLSMQCVLFCVRSDWIMDSFVDLCGGYARKICQVVILVSAVPFSLCTGQYPSVVTQGLPFFKQMTAVIATLSI